MKIFCSEDLFWFQQVIEAGIFFTETSDYFSEILWSPYKPCSQIWHFCVTFAEGFVHQLWHLTGFQLFCVNRHGCHMWGSKLVLTRGVHDFTHSLYAHYIICQSKGYVCGLVCLLDLFYLLNTYTYYKWGPQEGVWCYVLCAKITCLLCAM